MQNTDEWSKREQLETEKFQLEREIKKFKNQIADLEVRKKNHTQNFNNDLSSLFSNFRVGQ